MLAGVDHLLQFRTQRLRFRTQRDAPAQIHQRNAIDNLLHDIDSHADSSDLGVVIQIGRREPNKQPEV